MATAAGQVKAQQFNAKLENEARIVVDEIEKKYMRKVSQQGYACALKCYEKAGLSKCVFKCCCCCCCCFGQSIRDLQMFLPNPFICSQFTFFL